MDLLIVDDHPANLKLLRAQLEAEGHTVLEAANGVQALEVLEREKSVEGVISDILMPEMDGFRLCLEMRKNPAFSALPFIVYTSTYDSPQDRQLAKSVGADHYLTKPAPVAEILGALHEAAQRTRPRIAALAVRQDESNVLKQYNASLVRKLEERNIEVEKTLKNLLTANESLQESADELRRSESLKGAILETSLDCVITIDQEGRIIEFNPAAEATFGFTRGQALGKIMVDLIVPPRLRDAHRRGFAHYLATGKAPLLGKRVELEAIRADGTEFPIELAITATGGTSAPLFTGFIRDITAQKRAADELRESERRFSNLLGNIEMISLMLDTNAHITYCNDYLLRLTGWARAEVVGRDWFELFIPPEAADMKSAYAALLANHPASWHHENEILTRSGERRLIRWNNSVLRSAAGEVIGTASIGEDITEQKRAEVRIKRLNRVYAVLSGINTLIVRARDSEELFREACRIAVEDGQFGMAWIGRFDPATLDVTPVAWAGLEAQDYIGTAKATARADLPQGQGVLGRAIRELRPVFDNDISIDTGVGNVRRAEALRRGYRSLIVLPLIVQGAAAGNLSLFAREPTFFDEEELRLLTELAGDISFALENLGRQQKLGKLSRIRAVSSGINAAITRVKDRQGLLEATCNIAVEQAGLPLAWIGMLDPSTRNLKAAAMAGTLEYGKLLAPSIDSGIPAGQGTNGRAFREGNSVVDNNMTANPSMGYARSEGLKHGIQSAMSLPLVVEGAPVGVMGLYAKEKDFFDGEEISLLTEVAGNVSFALENISKQQKLEKLARIRMVSSEINAASVRIRERDALLKETCRIVSQHGKFEMIWISAIDHEQLELIAWSGFSEETARGVDWANISASKGTLGEALQNAKPSVRNDIEGELPGGKLRQEALIRGCRSSLALPLVVDDRVAALIVLFAQGTGFFDAEELALLNELAADVSFALQAIEKQKKLEYLSYYDVLTGLANRTLFLERVAPYTRSAASGGHKLALYLIDLERFKNINDTLGRPAGDALLKQVADWLTRHLGMGDANLVARVGADQFAVVLPEARQEADVASLLDKTMAAFLDHSFRLDDAVFRIAAKAGIALFPEDGADADTLFKHAEAALKKAKASGDRYLFYTQKMTDAVAGRLNLENQLRQALDNGEFVLHYQPKVNLVSGKLTSVEALIRWNDPRTGLVPPGRFIPILEETGLIHEVGRWALRKAVEDYLRWRAAGLPAVRIAVNVSPLQLRNRGFAAEIAQVVSRDAHAAPGLELEITESLIMEDVKHTIASLQAIRAMGVTIAIDDFGTGFSSLSYLSKLPVDTLKIDRSFVVGMTAGPDGLALVSTIINLAHSLNLKVVAEGVETQEQSGLLRLLRCDEMQGFLFSKPLPGEIFETRYLAPPPAEKTERKIPAAI
jgi:diguanylate cyclase (GGDEF)-like protein/PAS domain S-box-containing protein